MCANTGGSRYTEAVNGVHRHIGRRLSGRVRRRAVIVVGCLSAGVAGLLPASAMAFSEFYGGGTICGSNCYVQSAGAHTFKFNEGFAGSGKPKLACQLFNSNGANVVEHGAGYCIVSYFGGQFVWARVYNQGGTSVSVSGFAET
jgi:hypothetical protein